MLDVVLDLRATSASYGCTDRFTLSAQGGTAVYVPRGFAHGFCALSESATLVYLVSSTHSPEHDRGIRWDSIGIDWPTASPLLSDRDTRFATLREFDSPFA